MAETTDVILAGLREQFGATDMIDEGDAEAIKAALSRAGYAIVPVEPLREHIKALTAIAGDALANLPPPPANVAKLDDEPIWLQPGLLAPDMERGKP